MEDNEHLNREVSNKLYTIKTHLEEYIRIRTGYVVDLKWNMKVLYNEKDYKKKEKGDASSNSRQP